MHTEVDDTLEVFLTAAMHIAGSSGGSGASVAARIAPWSLCEDTGGSCRSPAIANGELQLAKQCKAQQT